MQKVLEFLNNHVKVSVAVVAFGIAVTLGWAKGCTVDVSPEAPAAVVVPVPAAE